MERLTILVSGMVAGVPRQGGATWAVLQYVLGLLRLGHDVYFVEPIEPGGTRAEDGSFGRTESAAYFRKAVSAFGLEDRASLVLEGTGRAVGLPFARLHRVARRADLLINIAGMLRDPALLEPIPVRMYLDLDPAFTQLWAEAEGIDMRFSGHTHFATVGQAIGGDGCSVPTCGLSWITTPQPVVLDRWPVADRVTLNAFTTIGNWRAYGSIDHDGIQYGQKAHSMRRFLDVATLTDERFVLALAIDDGEREDLEALSRHRWHLLDPARVVRTPAAYRRFIQGSKAEFGIAKSGYVAARCGWFSDRSVCYLASGRPVVTQDTGFARFLPAGEGVFAFDSTEEALTGIEAVRSDYPKHARAARAIAEECFDSDRVLSALIEKVGRAP
jgi:hypothetical protein